MGIFWPGTFSLAALKLPTAGTAMYAFMALAGDVDAAGEEIKEKYEQLSLFTS